MTSLILAATKLKCCICLDILCGICAFWKKGYLFTGDLVYKDILSAYYPSTDLEAYLDFLTKVAALPAIKCPLMFASS